MFSSILAIKSRIEEYSPKNYSLLLVIPVILLITGFLIWNFYLYIAFGFVEYEILRGQFISAGFSFLLSTLMLWALLDLIRRPLSFIYHQIFSHHSRVTPLRITCCLFLFIIWGLAYMLFIFPNLPYAFGGGQPRSLSLIADKETLPMLNSLEIKNADGAIHQTENLCIVHENSKGIYIIRNDRALMLNQSLFQGFGSILGDRVVAEQQCSEYIRDGIFRGLYVNVLLFFTNSRNTFSSIFGFPQWYFYISTSTPPM